MGKKVSPISLRIGITRTWDSKWYSKRGYKEKFLQDLAIRKFLEKKLASAGISRIEIIRSVGKVKITIHTPKPGMIVGRGGEAIGLLQRELIGIFKELFDVSVQEVRRPDADAKLIAENVAGQITRRFPYRRVAKMALEKARESGVKGVKILIAGRLNGVDIARSEKYSYGQVPLHTLRAKIDYAHAGADTAYGVIGVKVWVYHGLVFKNQSIEG
ncbi:30S ribosomal protein S3 [Candidatus Gracilibacteria bacterium]|nr:30S ribosomal protein S3 [Candidatus Gracilibacteria bacterium]